MVLLTINFIPTCAITSNDVATIYASFGSRCNLIVSMFKLLRHSITVMVILFLTSGTQIRYIVAVAVQY